MLLYYKIDNYLFFSLCSKIFVGDIMNFLKDKYIILEIIPTTSNKDSGDIVELTALKMDGMKLIDRFNYRLNKDKVLIKEFLEMCNYDNDEFIYLDNSKDILNKLREFVGNLPLVLINDTYTLNYLEDFPNKKELIFPYLELEYNDSVIQNMINKYGLEESNYLVDLVYEAIIRHF